MSKFASAGAHPPLGTLIDNDSLELVELVGSGGYGVVYRAVETTAKPGRKRRTFAIKVLSRTDGRRNTHIREASLHYHVSGHPHIIDLYQVLEDDKFMYFVMQYARSKDLFHQILNKSYYLGNDHAIKMVFLQLLDGVDHLHKMGVYHRDLKPENILCLDDGYRIAISDFGLATTETSSVEFRTGSIYHMSPECQSGRYAEDAYSPMSNDIWSLGIILLNMVTGRNPWKSATIDDPVFQSYCHSPFNFFCSVLPISSALNKVILQVLDPNWKTRMSLQRFRKEVEKIKTFYSAKVIFEGSLARCPWEVDAPPPPPKPAKVPERKPVMRRPVPPTPAGTKPFQARERETPASIPPPPPEADKAAASPSPRPASSPTARPVAPPQRRPVPAMADDANLEASAESTEVGCDSSMKTVSLGEDVSFSPSTTPEDPHTPSQLSSASSTLSFPKTPELDGGFIRRRNKIDVKIMASTRVSPSSSFGGDACSPPTSTGDFSSYLDMSFSNELFKPAADATMLSPAPSQYSLHEASDYSMWTEAGKEMPYPIGNDPRTAYPELKAPAASKPIDIIGARQRHPSHNNLFNSSYHQFNSNSNSHYSSHSSVRLQSGYLPPPAPRVTGVRKLWSRDKKLPPRPVPTYTGRPYCGPPIYHHQTGGKWFEGKV